VAVLVTRAERGSVPVIAPGVDVRIRQAVAGTGLTLRQFAVHMADHRGDVPGWSYSNLAEFGRERRVRIEHLEAIAEQTAVLAPDGAGTPLWFLLGGWAAAPAVDASPGEQQILSELAALREHLNQRTER
jgi:hypothetical protein